MPTSPRRTELLDAAYAYVLDHGLGDLSLRPLAAAVGSSPRVLLYLFGSKEALVTAILGRAREDEVTLLAAHVGDRRDLVRTARAVWGWLVDPAHRKLLVLWLEVYARSVSDQDGPWAAFAERTVEDWLALLPRGRVAERTLCLAVLRGALLDLLATGDVDRLTAAVRLHLRRIPR